jgi:CBS domain-containing protein
MVLRAKDIMDTNILTIDSTANALECARRMAAARKGYAVVTHDGPTRIAGIVTEWDFLEKIVAAGRDPGTVPIPSIASEHVQSCAPETPTDEVATRMAELGIRRIVVRSGENVVGIITSRNLIRTFREYIDKISAEIAAYHSQSTALG